MTASIIAENKATAIKILYRCTLSPCRVCSFYVISTYDTRRDKTLFWSRPASPAGGLETLGQNYRFTGFPKELLLGYKHLQRKPWYVPGMVAPEGFLYANKAKCAGSEKRKPDWVNPKFQPCFKHIFTLTSIILTYSVILFCSLLQGCSNTVDKRVGNKTFPALPFILKGIWENLQISHPFIFSNFNPP